MSKEELILKMGEEYFVAEGPSELGAQLCLEYPKYRIQFIFDNNDIVLCVFCYEGADINGAHLGMNAKEIQDVLGECEIIDLMGHGPQAFALKYEYDSYSIWFSLYPDEYGKAEVVNINLWQI